MLSHDTSIHVFHLTFATVEPQTNTPWQRQRLGFIMTFLIANDKSRSLDLD